MAEEMQQDEGYQQFDGQNGNGDAAEETDHTKTEDEEDEDERKLFIGGLKDIDKMEEVKTYFEKFGTVKNVMFKTDPATGKSRGFCFVVYESAESVQKVLAEKEHNLQGKVLDAKKANPRPVNKKIFVGRLDQSAKQEEIEKYFEENFGPVEKIELPFDKTANKRRAFAFVEFKKLAHFKKCLEQEKQTIPTEAGPQEVEVKKATPPGGGFNYGGNFGGRGGPRGRGFGPGGRGGRGGYGGYGYDQGYGYGGYDQGYYGNYGYGGDYYGQGYGYGGWDQGYGQGGYGYGGYAGYGQSNYGKAQKRGAGGYHPYNR